MNDQTPDSTPESDSVQTTDNQPQTNQDISVDTPNQSAPETVAQNSTGTQEDTIGRNGHANRHGHNIARHEFARRHLRPLGLVGLGTSTKHANSRSARFLQLFHGVASRFAAGIVGVNDQVELDEQQHKAGPVTQIVADARNIDYFIVSEKDAESKKS